MKQTGYKVPQGYFEQLQESIVQSAQVMQAQIDAKSAKRPVFRVQMRSAAVFAASFAAMVVLAMTGYYFTGYKAQEAELAQTFDEMSLMYGVDELDLMDITISDQPNLVAEASIEYLEVFGYPDLEIEE